MKIFAIADLHLSFGVPNKSMEIFGDNWIGWTDKIANNWKQRITNDDLVLLPGDLSWGMNLKEAMPDLRWIDNLPGTKVILRGNHDYWWESFKKVQNALPPSIQAIQNNAFDINTISIAGARLWDSDALDFSSLFELKEEDKRISSKEDAAAREKIFAREINRLELSLKCLSKDAKVKIAMTHYPPIDPKLMPSQASALFEAYGVSHVVFGHLHNVKKEEALFGKARGVNYHLVACDATNFYPMEIKI